MPRRWKLLLIVAPIVIAIDQVTKYVARAVLPVDGRGFGIPVPVIDNYFDWILAYNTGSAFSLFHGTAGARIFLTVVGFAAVGAVVWLVHRSRDDQLAVVGALSLMAGGALGNLIDRVLFGKVTDFVLWRYHEHTWPVFNFADVCLSVAVAVFLAASLAAARRERIAKRTGAVTPTSAR